ncbi:hypothetical protein KP79_PYT03531 [Mizuhopecten yessoensis]|uniref:Uncharacterized protein n=1 Tax=Mizuhopecten yessoensis TaxID=6573 RepID=A0A210R3V1_MIZYE|nr:hypothetical protein KP79_PYT03531 [Mizuhopecten yessoensis]
MSEFTSSFPAIVNRDIRHIYSGFPDFKPIARHAKPFPTVEQLRQKQAAHLLKTAVLRTSKYDDNIKKPQYIPRAPAFRAFPANELRPITARLVKPTVASAVKRTKSDLEDDFTSNFKAIQHAKVRFPKFMGLRKVDEGELQVILLHVSRPTKISDIRARVNNRQMATVKAIETARKGVYSARINRGHKKDLLLPRFGKVM